jgi:hypothetical protein
MLKASTSYYYRRGWAKVKENWQCCWSLVLCWIGLLAGCCEADPAVSQESAVLKATITDAATGLPTACTVRITDALGKNVLERESFNGGVRCDGHFTKRLLAGRTELRVTRGFETKAAERVIELPAGASTEIKITLERIIDLRRRGWYCGDSHVHMLHGERTLPVDFDFVALTAQAEDLQYMSLAQAWIIENPTPGQLEDELGKRSKTDCILTWNLEAPKNYYRGDAGRCLGHCWMLGVDGHMPGGENVISLLLQASAHDYESEKPTFANFESHQLIHAQGGSVFYSHPARWWTGPWGGRGGYTKQEKMRVSNMAAELPLDTLAGPTFDGLDLITGPGEFEANAMAFELWCLLLNHGYRLAGTASSDACFDRAGGAIPGVVRTYTYLAESFSLPVVTRAVAGGANFATSGPLLLASVDGRPPGSVFPAYGQACALKVEAWASGTDPQGLSRLELLRNGQLVQTILFSPSVPSFQTNLTLQPKENCWYCLRLTGSDPQRQRAISGAFFFEKAGFRPPQPLPAQVRVLLQDADTGRRLTGSVTEVALMGPLPHRGTRHVVAGEASLAVPAIMRLEAEAPGYQSQTKSSFLDYPPLLTFICGLSAEDLLKWETFERVRALLGQVDLTFNLKKAQ